ncbi:TPL1 [Cyberlindnera jadinii]|uniref:Very-long-chain (3R)-3-hydroxyacyl-CoA dehydratase n=1 Tax=Cyberlindnera jadinii (strain ATCC 18201 / CBS 1600 / BCRC 20928 / JCM 3617 / NBRC 0987 / NRRL Y-1542) TaxID=983966 RepID=A0A0H5C2T0_CYBJN|nr:3-hydroxyacyl-CoA dehydratase [Cyberlindnera jadinii NRRL Y-1542]ODV72718.1 3-hydroxyacyl-CoA dehydratase [Cyberlindnera jadinii NRRL Y-1542]CEP22255.1 TPL1 [Cyberlindnera jadinii]
MSSRTREGVPRHEDPDVKKQLFLYNNFSATLWVVVLGNTIFLSLLLGQPFLFEKSRNILVGIQTLALYEIYNSYVGNVRSPVMTTLMQVSSRLLIVWGIFVVLPNSPANVHWAYITLNVAWSITEIVRYFYYAQVLVSNGEAPYVLTWLRYNLFFVLYPLGVGSELTIIYKSLDEAASQVGAWYKYFLIICMLTYIPGFPVLFGHMLKQRKKVMKALNGDSKKQK